MNNRILRIGHRGSAGYAPENTLAAIEKGLAIGCDYVEIDVQLTADRHLVIMHDKRVDRTTTGTGNVSDLSLPELRSLDAGVGQRIPILTEVLPLVKGRAGLMVEIITPGIAADVVSVVRAACLSTPVLYASFLHSEIVAVREHDPEAQTLALLEGVPISGGQFALEAQASHVGLGFDSVTAGYIRDLHACHLTVFVYTLNDPRDIARARTLGVDGIISDYPDRVGS